MAKFAYTAVDAKGAQVYDVVEAEDEKEALKIISDLGLFPTQVHRAHLGDELRHGIQDRFEAEQKRREEEERRRHKEVRKRHTRRSLVVRFKDGTVKFGVAFRLNHHDPDFYLDVCDDHGRSLEERIRVAFEDVKIVCNVKSYTGKFNPAHFKPTEAEGDAVVVVFTDGEVLEGTTMQRGASRQPRFFVVPKDQESNNISILVEGSATRFVGSPEEYKAQRREERAEQVSESAAPPTQEETTGDFYFEMRDYDQALQNYLAAATKVGESRRLKKKLLATHYNIGIRFLKRRDYPTALQYMEQVLAIDPRNESARKKYTKLKRIIAHEANADED